MKQKHFIDSHKALTFFYVLGLIAFYGRWENTTALVYLALHGGYGFMWLIKSRTFGDKQWEQACSIGYGAFIWVVLSLYWIAPWMICYYNIEAPALWVGFCVFVYGFGVFYHFASDMQKDYWLRFNAGNLLNEGLWSRVRNPNYFGELLIYFGFTALAMHWLPLLALFLVILGIWVPNMRRKDASLSRYPQFVEYKARSKLLIPYLL